MTPTLWILLLIALSLVLIGGWTVVTYNRLVRLRQFVHEAWSAIDTELQRRHDLIPSLVEVVKGYAAHERQTLERVIAARAEAVADHGPVESKAAHETELVGALQRLLVIAEAYPDLKASDRFLDLQHQLVETETRLSKARRFYNANVREINTTVHSFPTTLLARPLGFTPQPYFEVEESARAAPGVRME